MIASHGWQHTAALIKSVGYTVNGDLMGMMCNESKQYNLFTDYHVYDMFKFHPMHTMYVIHTTDKGSTELPNKSVQSQPLADEVSELPPVTMILVSSTVVSILQS